MIYCDTSLLIPILVPEVNTEAARAWMFSDDRPTCSISDWTLTELASALARKLRNGLLDVGQRRIAEGAWLEWQARATRLAVAPTHFEQAARLVDSEPRGLRSGDALHLAIAIDHGCDLATFDRDLADAARARGIRVHPG